MNENYWKNAYKETWNQSSEREIRLMNYIKRTTGRTCVVTGLGAGSAQYISGSAYRNGYQKGDADFSVEGTNIYIEVTGPLTSSVKDTAPLWFRPDKLMNAIENVNHDVFLVHHCMSADLWRVIHVDDEFKQRFMARKFRIVKPVIRGRQETYVQIEVNDKAIRNLEYLVEYIRNSGR